MANKTITSPPTYPTPTTVRLPYDGGYYEFPRTYADPLDAINAKLDKLLAASAPAPAPTPAPALPGATWSDDFAKDDPARWVQFDGAHWPPPAGTPGKWARCFYYGWPTNSGSQDAAARTLRANKEAECYEDRAVTIGPDGLVLTATRDSSNHFGMPWTSGCVVQNINAAQMYGRFECVAHLPKGRGFWPAFWLLAADLSWPPEIDVMEKVGLDQNNAVTDDVYRAGVVQAQGFWQSATKLDQWHTYGVIWTKDTITFTFDGKSIGNEPNNINKPMFMLLNLAVGGPGSWPGEPDVSATTASMVVRSVASYPG